MPHGAHPGQDKITPELLMRAYALGIFPMAEHRDDPEIFWVDPHMRGLIPLDRFHVSRSLAKTIRKHDYKITINQDFEGVVDGCSDRADTWISSEIRNLYSVLHTDHRAHSLEVWREGVLVGGVYGVTLGTAFFGESMFSRARDASKIALAWLVDHLNRCGFSLFDTQFITPHLASLGAIEISRSDYHNLLESARDGHAKFDQPSSGSVEDVVLQRITQMSNRA